MNKKPIKITQDNRLIRASYYLTLAEKRVVLLAISKEKKGNLNNIEVSVDDYKAVFTNSEPFRDLRTSVERLWERTIYNLDGHPDRKTRWFKDIKFNENEKLVKLSFVEELEPYLFELKRCFTSYHLDKISAVKSSYSIRLYELLMQFKSTGEFYITLDELKKAFGVSDKYPTFASFKQRVLNPALKDLKIKSDYKIKFKEVKKGRKVNGFCFYFEQKAQGEFKF